VKEGKFSSINVPPSISKGFFVWVSHCCSYSFQQSFSTCFYLPVFFVSYLMAPWLSRPLISPLFLPKSPWFGSFSRSVSTNSFPYIFSVFQGPRLFFRPNSINASYVFGAKRGPPRLICFGSCHVFLIFCRWVEEKKSQMLVVALGWTTQPMFARGSSCKECFYT
jgi:hypothetical protein